MTARVLLLVMDDGRRDYLDATVRSLALSLYGPVVRRVIHDDSGDPAYGDRLREDYPSWRVFSTGGRSGFGGAIRSAWQLIERDYPEVTHVLHVEGDFTLNRAVDVGAMCALLDRHPHLVQVVLMRQPWNATEKAAGSLWATRPANSWDDRTDAQTAWVEHRHWFSTNPCVYRRSLLNVGWPEGAESEGRFGLGLLERGTPEVSGDDVRFAFWGTRDDGPWVTHIGEVRAGGGY